MEVLGEKELIIRRERVFLILAAVFIAAMTMLNVIGTTRFIEIAGLSLAVGVLPYPLTFLCTDLISELYGKKRATFLVWVGLGLNIFVIGVLWLGKHLPEAATVPPWQTLDLANPLPLPTGEILSGTIEPFDIIYACTVGSVFASMLAYVAAQFVDVQLFHFWKKLTKGKYLWMRNNFSTLVSQMVDSFTVISIVFGAAFYRGELTLKAMLILMGSNYLFKMVVALLDTGPFYLAVKYLSQYLRLDPVREHDTHNY
jgi:uncharacterized PurR-regulated membrane protein YhhQ (DUF165 family)